MPPAIDAQIKGQVIKEWLSGNTRDEIAANNKIGAGTVSNIISEWKKGLSSKDYDSIRDLSAFLEKQGVTYNDLVTLVRLNSYVKKLGVDFEQIESFISNVANSQDPEKLIDTANQIVQLSGSESIPLDKIEDHIKGQIGEKKKLQKEVEKARQILKQTSINVQTVKEYNRLKEELYKGGLSTNDLHNLVSILKKFKKMRYDPRKIVAELSSVRSLRQQEKQLKNSCKMWESHASRYKEIIPLCEQLLQLGIGFAELSAVHAAVVKKVNTEKISCSRAAFALMDGIDTANKLFDAKKQLNDTWMQIQLLNLFSARQNKALTALIKLQSFGVTDKEILNIYEFLNGSRLESAKGIGTHNYFDPYLFNSYDTNNNGLKFGAPKLIP